MSESPTLKSVRLLSVGPVRLYRNNSGALFDVFKRLITFGVGSAWAVVKGKRKWTGGSDLIGWKTVTVTPEMVGRRIAVFVAIETKSETGPVEQSQQNFLDAVTKAGGLAGVARSVEDARRILEGL